MSYELSITPHGRLILVESPTKEESAPLSKQTIAAFAESSGHGLLNLATHELQARLPIALDYFRSFARTYLTRLCQTSVAEGTKEIPPTPPPDTEWASWILQACNWLSDWSRRTQSINIGWATIFSRHSKNRKRLCNFSSRRLR